MKRIKKWFWFKIREIISKAINHDAITLGSHIKILEKRISCLQGFHEWEDWSATACGNVSLISKMKEKSEKLYSYRACRNCYIEMPESRDYYQEDILEKNAKRFANN